MYKELPIWISVLPSEKKKEIAGDRRWGIQTDFSSKYFKTEGEELLGSFDLISTYQRQQTASMVSPANRKEQIHTHYNYFCLKTSGAWKDEKKWNF